MLITGAGTMLGARLIENWHGSGGEVVAQYRSANDRIRRLQRLSGVSLVQGDLAEPEVYSRIPSGTRSLVHLAASSPGPRIGLKQLIHDNVTATARLIEWALVGGIEHVVFFSTISVFGTPSGPSVDSRSTIVDPGPYGTTKLLCEQLLEDCSDQLPSVSLRIPAMLGPGAHRHFLAKLLERAKAGLEIRIFSPEAPFNNAVHVDDLVPFVRSLYDHAWSGADVLTLAAAGSCPVREVAERIVAGAGSRSSIVVEEADRQPFWIDDTRARECFGYSSMAIETMLDKYAREGS